MGAWVHRLAVDADGVGTCAKCGPVRAIRSGNHWACPTGRAEQRKPRTPEQAKHKQKMKLAREKAYRAQFVDAQCAICSVSLANSDAMVDHDHAVCGHKRAGYRSYCPRCVRGTLCRRCNTGLGCFNDDPARLVAAAKYVSN